METRFDLLEGYIEDVITAENRFEDWVRGFASTCDDDEVTLTFIGFADAARVRRERLILQLPTGASSSSHRKLFGRFFDAIPGSAQLGHVQEERTVQSILMGYTMAAAGCAMYEALQNFAAAAAETELAALAKEMLAQNAKSGEKLFHFISTRSIIAYNMLTIAEVDPAVETKLGEASWTG